MISRRMMMLLFVYVIHCNADHEENVACPMSSNQLLSETSLDKYKTDDEDTASVYERSSLNASMLRSPDPIITRTQVAIGTFSMIISNSFSLVVLGYLANISLAKDCLLLYLYKDLIRLGICLNCLGEISLVLIYSTEDGTGIPGTRARILSFLALNIFLLLSLSMNAIAAMKLYMKVTNMLDPPMPWEDDDGKGMKWIRMIAAMFTLLFTSITFGIGIYPKTYYWFSGQEMSFYEDTAAPIIYPTVFLFLMSTCIIVSLGLKIYKWSSPHLADAGIPQQINYFYWTLGLVLFFMILISELNVLSSKNVWKLWQFNVVVIQVGSPIITVLRSKQLRHFTYNFVRNRLEELFFYQIYLTPTLLCMIIYSTLYFIYDCFEI